VCCQLVGCPGRVAIEEAKEAGTLNQIAGSLYPCRFTMTAEEIKTARDRVDMLAGVNMETGKRRRVPGYKGMTSKRTKRAPVVHEGGKDQAVTLEGDGLDMGRALSVMIAEALTKAS